jgi:hypothetical protein
VVGCRIGVTAANLRLERIEIVAPWTISGYRKKIMANWQLDDPNVLGLIIGIIALGFAIFIFALQYKIDKDVHNYIKRQQKIEDSIRSFSFETMATYLKQAHNDIHRVLDSLRQHSGSEEEKRGHVNRELEYPLFSLLMLS